MTSATWTTDSTGSGAFTPRTIIGMAHNSGPAGHRDLPAQAFFKPLSSLVGPGEAIVLPEEAGVVIPEAEIAVVIGRRCRRLAEEEVADVVLGWTVANDVTSRDLLSVDQLWWRAKSIDTFTPLSPQLRPGMPTGEERIDLVLNGSTYSSATLSDLARGPVEILVYLSTFMTLNPGDVVLTGAPGAVTPLSPGDVVAVRVSDAAGTLELENPVQAG